MLSSLAWEDRVLCQNRRRPWSSTGTSCAEHTSFTLDLLKVTSEEGTFRYSANFRPASTDALDINKPIGIPGMADWPSGQADQYYFVTVRHPEQALTMHLLLCCWFPV